MTGGAQIKAIGCSVVLLCLLLPVHEAHAFGSGQWEWKVVGLSGTYPTKEAAHAALLARGGNYQYLDKEEGISDLNGQWVTYKYSATPRNAVILSEWDYRAGIYHFPTEAELVAAGLQNLAENYSDPECPPTLTPATEWAGTTYWGIPNSEWRDYDDYRGNWVQTPPPAHCVWNGPHLWRIHRARSVGCEWPFTPNATLQKCLLGTVGYITGHPLVCSGQCTKNPVDVSSGDKVQREIDYSGPAFTFTRTYHSQGAQSTAALGVGWTHNFNSRLIVLSSSPKGLVRADGFHEPFDSKSGYWMSRTGAVRVEQQGSQYTAYYENNSREIYSDTGRLLKTIAPNGQETVVQYDSSNRVSAVTGPFGHTLTFTYDGTSGYLSSVTDPAGELIEFSYNTSARNLTEVLYPDGTSREYHYEDSGFPNHLTGITDENGDRYKTASYDSSGRVVMSELLIIA